MLITNKSQVSGYNSQVWFDQKSITNIIYLKNLINQYFVTYDILYEMSLSTKKNI